MWTHRDLVEDFFTFDDLLDIHEVMAVKNENEWRSYESAKERKT